MLASGHMNGFTLVGIDTGGTFTDIVVLQDGPDGRHLRQCKVLSNPADPSAPIVAGLEQLGLADQALQIIHGTTVGTNAVLEGKGARVAYITSKGFADVLTLGRQEREQVYQLRQPELQPPVPVELCLEVETRIMADASLQNEASAEQLEQLKTQLLELDVESVAINLLFSFLQPEAEQRIAEALGGDWFISCSSNVLPEIREYERGIATWLNASVGPVISRYLTQLLKRLPDSRIAIMQSAGTTIAADQAAQQAVRLLLSGPAGGLAAAHSIGKQTGNKRLMSFDMGGTSTDVALLDGKIPLTSQSRLGRWPLAIPSVDIHTIGAGGGSIAKTDAAGMLLVGPESAGASPGPACYDMGGTDPTVTDANLLLGLIPADTLLGGYLPLNLELAEQSMSKLATGMGCDLLDAARGVISMANEHMARALRLISVERGHNPAKYTLLCFGGAGGLHACDLAELLGMQQVIIPARSGVLSALGMLVSEPGRELSRAVLAPLSGFTDQDIGLQFKLMEADAVTQLQAEGYRQDQIVFGRQLELRYTGQSASINIDWIAGGEHQQEFHQAHARASGMQLPHPVELVNVRLSARAPAVLDGIDDPAVIGGDSVAEQVFLPALGHAVPLYHKAALSPGVVLEGPLILVEADATAWVKPAWSANMDKQGNLLLHKKTRD